MTTLCNCPECGGKGTIVCPECEGKGTYRYANLANAVIPKGIAHEDELRRLVQDARRVNSQAKRLTALVPAAAHSYESQRKATIFAIETEAERLLQS
jgi:DnaJ-class molecular chaperone